MADPVTRRVPFAAGDKDVYGRRGVGSDVLGELHMVPVYLEADCEVAGLDDDGELNVHGDVNVHDDCLYDLFDAVY